jgi:IS30 family transposase
MCSEKEIYNLINSVVLKVRNIDLTRKVRYRTTSTNKTSYKIDKECLNNRKYDDYIKFINENPDVNIVEIDTVEGIKGGKVLLTIHFVNCSFMLAFLREHNDAQSVINTFNSIEDELKIDLFKKLFPVILTDNGSEFSNPLEIEFSRKTGERRTQIFYCEPGRPDQKGSCEVNHEMIRRILPKGTSFDDLTQEDINKMMSHINSYKRKKLNNCSPLQLFRIMYGKDIAKQFGIIEINFNDINLSKNLLKKD